MAGNDFKAAVERLIVKEPKWKAATTPAAKGVKPSTRGTGLPASGAQARGSGLDESDYTLREYWPAIVSAISSDGLITVEEEPIKKIGLVGGDAITFQQPV